MILRYDSALDPSANSTSPALSKYIRASDGRENRAAGAYQYAADDEGSNKADSGKL